jgi:hypothetical protein
MSDLELARRWIGLFSGPFPETVLSRSRRGLKTAISGSSAQKRKGSTLGGSPMRIILALALLGASLSLSGCFHHNQAVYAEPLPPPAHPPLK